MLTQQLVKPSYKCIRLTDHLCCIPVSLDLKTGRLRWKEGVKVRAIHNTLFILSILKAFRLASALVFLLVEYKSESFANIFLTFTWFCLIAATAYWGWELFQRGISETVLLFNYLKFDSVDHASSSGRGVWRIRSLQDVRAMCAWLWAQTLKQLLSLNLQELMCVMTPFVVSMLPPASVLLMTIAPHWKIFATSLVQIHADVSFWTWTSGLLVVFEVLTAIYGASNLLFLIFFELALQVTEHRLNQQDIQQIGWEYLRSVFYL